MAGNGQLLVLRQTYLQHIQLFQRWPALAENSGGLLVESYLKPEDAADPEFALHAHLAAHQFHQLLGDRRAQPGAAVGAGDVLVGLGETLEYSCLVLQGDTDAGIDHVEPELGFVIILLACAYPEFRAALAGEFYCIADHVDDDLLQMQRIAFQHEASLRRETDG